MKPRALMLSPELPYPLQGGGALRTASLLNYLAQHHTVDLILFRHLDTQAPLESLPKDLVDRVLVLELPRHSRNPAARAIRNTRRLLQGRPPLVDRFDGFSAEIERFCSGHKYQVAVIEHFWCAPYQAVLKPYAEHVILNLHNIESQLHTSEAQAAPTPMERAAHRQFAKLYRCLESQWLPQFDEVLTASEPDRARVLPHSRCVSVYPNAIPWRPSPEVDEEEVIAFSGNFDYHPNKLAVAWFAKHIWPCLSKRHPTLRWRLIGMNPESVLPSLANLPRVEWTGPVSDAVQELARAKVVIVPLQSGSGTRLKIIEAWAARRPVISTPIGAEGLGEEGLLLAEPESFLESLHGLLTDTEQRQDLAEKGRACYERSYTWDAAWLVISRRRATY